MLALLAFAYPNGFEGAGTAFLVVLALLVLSSAYRALRPRRSARPRPRSADGACRPHLPSDRAARRARKKAAWERDKHWIVPMILMDEEDAQD
jgi:hypothetical protein